MSATPRSNGCAALLRPRGARSGRRSSGPRRRRLASASLRAVAACARCCSRHGSGARVIGRRADRADRRTDRLPAVLLAALPRWEAEGKLENLAELVGVAREYQAENDPRRRSPAFLQEISLYSDQDALRRRGERGGQVTMMTAHNAKGLEFGGRVHARDGGGDLPASRAIEENSDRGGATPVLRRHDPRQGAADDAARLAALALRPQRGEPAVALPRRAARGADRARAARAERPGRATRPAGRLARWQSYRPSAADPCARRPATRCRHGTLGSGIVTRIEPDGVVTVRFEDGSERRLILEYAPLEKDRRIAPTRADGLAVSSECRESGRPGGRASRFSPPVELLEGYHVGGLLAARKRSRRPRDGSTPRPRLGAFITLCLGSGTRRGATRRTSRYLRGHRRAARRAAARRQGHDRRRAVCRPLRFGDVRRACASRATLTAVAQARAGRRDRDR